MKEKSSPVEGKGHLHAFRNAQKGEKKHTSGKADMRGREKEEKGWVRGWKVHNQADETAANRDAKFGGR